MTTRIAAHPTLFPDHLNDEQRHWEAGSEPFTGCDALFSAMQHGWQITNIVFCKTFYYSGKRTSHVFYFQLLKDGQITRMGVISNPTVLKFIEDAGLEVFAIKDQAQLPVLTIKTENGETLTVAG